MAPPPVKDQSNTSTTPPPPLQHLTTAEAPRPPPQLPLSESSDENPFIQFRRFADSQISSLLQSVIGLPSLFHQPTPSARWVIIDQDAAMRRQQELEMDRALRGPSTPQTDAANVHETWGPNEQEAAARKEMGKWGASTTTVAESPTPPAQASHYFGEKEKKDNKWYSGLGWDGKQRCRKDSGAPNDSSDKGEDQLRYRSSTSLDPFTNPNDAIPWLLTDPYSPLILSGCMRFHIDGFKTVNGYVRDDNSTLAFVPPSDATILEPHYTSPRIWYPYQKRMRNKVQWGDAFEDLIQLQNTGRMANREYSKRMDMTWLKDTIDRGILGRKWVSLELPNSISSKVLFQNLDTDEYFIGSKSRRFWGLRQMLHRTRGWDDQCSVDDNVQELQQASRDKVNVAAEQEEVAQENMFSGKNPSREVGIVPKLPSPVQQSTVETNSTLDSDGTSSSTRPEDIVRAIEQQFGRNPRDAEFMEEMMKRTSEFLGSPSEIDDFIRDLIKRWPTPEEVAEAMRAASASQTEKEAPEPELEEPKELDMSDSDPQSTTYYSSSSTASSYSHAPEEDGKADSIISTLTTTQRRTLPNGTIEVTRVLKKRFSDGTEETNESVERINGSVGDPRKSNPECLASADSKDMQDQASRERSLKSSEYRDQSTSTDERVVQEKKTNKDKKGGGWFWN